MYDDTSVDDELIRNWSTTGLLHNRVIKSHRAPRTVRFRSAAVAMTGIMAATTSLITYVDVTSGDTSVVHPLTSDRMFTYDDSDDRLTRLNESSRGASRIPIVIPPRTTRAIYPELYNDAQRAKRVDDTPIADTDNILWYSNRSK